MRRGLVQDRFVAGSGFVEPRQCGEHVAALEQRVDRTAVARQHLVEREQRVVEAPQTRQHHGAIVKRIEIAGIERDQPLASSQRLLEPNEAEPSASSAAIKMANAWGDRGRSLIAWLRSS